MTLEDRVSRLEDAVGAEEPAPKGVLLPETVAVMEEIRRRFPDEVWPATRHEYFSRLGELLAPDPDLKGRVGLALEAQLEANKAVR